MVVEFFLLTWEFVSLDGYAIRGEVLGEKLRLGSLARPIETLDDDKCTANHDYCLLMISKVV